MVLSLANREPVNRFVENNRSSPPSVFSEPSRGVGALDSSPSRAGPRPSLSSYGDAESSRGRTTFGRTRVNSLAGRVSGFDTRPSLVAQIRKGAGGDPWKQFQSRYRTVVFAFCRKQGLTDPEALDLTDGVFEVVRASIAEFDPASEGLRTWLGRIVREQLAEFTRRLPGARKRVGDLDLTSGEFWDIEFNAQVLRAALSKIRREMDRTEWKAFGNRRPSIAGRTRQSPRNSGYRFTSC